MKRTRFLLILDSILLLALIVLQEPRSSLMVHEWLGIAVIPLLVVHLLYAWRWIAATLPRLTLKGAWRLRVNVALNAALFVAFTVVLFSGVMISFIALPSLGIPPGDYARWLVLHNQWSLYAQILAGLHIAMNWGWIVGAVRRVVLARPSARGDAALGALAAAPEEILTMAQTVFRTFLVLLTAAIVIAAAIALTPPFDPRREEAEQMQPAKSPPTPASAAALRQAIAEAQSGIPDYDRARQSRLQLIARLNMLQRAAAALEGGIPVPTNQALLANARRQQQELAKYGPLKTIAYLAPGGPFDRYLVTFAHGPLLWFVFLDKDGKLANYGFDSLTIPTPQTYIENYAQFGLRERSARLATQLVILLVVAAFGRLALRLRL